MAAFCLLPKAVEKALSVCVPHAKAILSMSSDVRKHLDSGSASAYQSGIQTLAEVLKHQLNGSPCARLKVGFVLANLATILVTAIVAICQLSIISSAVSLSTTGPNATTSPCFNAFHTLHNSPADILGLSGAVRVDKDGQEHKIPTSDNFPGHIMCDMAIRTQGPIQRFTINCILPSSELAIKLCSLIWIWFLGLIVFCAGKLLAVFFRDVLPLSHSSFLSGFLEV